MKVLELKGLKSLRALNAFHTLMLGIKMLPSYMQESYEAFYTRVSLMPEKAQENIIREAVLFVELNKEDVEALVQFCTDKNGVPYGPSNIGNLEAGELVEIIVLVCMEISKIKIDLITEDEKKKSLTSP